MAIPWLDHSAYTVEEASDLRRLVYNPPGKRIDRKKGRERLRLISPPFSIRRRPDVCVEAGRSLATFGPVFAQIYGQGEAPMTITSLRRRDHAADADALLGSVGFARSGVEVAVVDADGRPLPPGEVGEIVCRGDVVTAGYWDNPRATAEALRDGWLYTCDMGSFDRHGYLTLRDRSKDVIISGGSNIYPREVEEVLLRHADVAEVCVTGQPDPE
ncbi:Putative AMP dependent synthase and ligase (plasmid) [Azospirillum lipoferum 4B]|uniref:AMP dependent synthase and ligase n=1 Tax=Azospirillum lipoferum (strain 4B) TaxID=862719 RepID=G7ZCR8_AZOL4|nr:Putative AMP dependent synthase and ligase [Azospirillum lipoferum 4B]